jgi:SPP1 gp7 family putative phage head morphogenesis protein
MLGMTDDDTRANAQEGRRNAWQDTILPYLERFATGLEDELLPKLPSPWSAYGIKFDVSHIDALKEDVAAKWATGKVIFDTFPDLTLGHVASILDLEIPEDVPLDATKPEPEPMLPQPGAPAIKAMVDVMEFPTFRRIAARTFAESVEAFERSVKKRAESISRGYVKKAKRLAEDLAQEAGTAVLERDFAPDQIDALLPEIETWMQLLADQVVPLEVKLYLLQGRLIADAAGAEAISVMGADAYAMQFIANKEIALKETLVTLRESVRKAIARSLLEDGGAGTLADQIRNALEKYESELEIMRGSLGARAERIARTEGTSIANAARMREAQLQGVTEMRWITARDAAVRHTHAELDGRTRPIGEEFGHGLKFPGDPDADVSQLANCRCTVTPTVRGVGREKAASLNRWHQAMYGVEA